MVICLKKATLGRQSVVSYSLGIQDKILQQFKMFIFTVLYALQKSDEISKIVHYLNGPKFKIIDS